MPPVRLHCARSVLPACSNWHHAPCHADTPFVPPPPPLQGVPNNYETDLIYPIIEKAAQLAGIDYHKSDALTQTALKVIGDHTRAVTYLMSDGVTPSNVGRGYIVRRLLRR